MGLTQQFTSRAVFLQVKAFSRLFIVRGGECQLPRYTVFLYQHIAGPFKTIAARAVGARGGLRPARVEICVTKLEVYSPYSGKPKLAAVGSMPNSSDWKFTTGFLRGLRYVSHGGGSLNKI